MQASVISRAASFRSFTVSLHTDAPRQFIDITHYLTDAVTGSGIENGLAVVTSQHTTAAIVINEHEPLLLQDLDRFLLSVAPDHIDYAHNAVPCLPGEVPNGHSHCQALLLGASVSIPIVGNDVLLGRYQRLFLVELDSARPRRVTFVLLGV